MLQKIPVRPEDETFLFQLFADTRISELQALGWEETMLQNFLQMQWKAQKHSYAMQFPGAEHSLLIYQNFPTGRVIVSRTELELRLVDLTLLAESRNRGIGTLLLQELQSEASSSNIPLRLSVLKTNPARRLYVRLGFLTQGEDELYDFMEWCQPLTGRAFQ